MNQDDPLIPRKYAQLAVGTAIILALIGAAIWIGNYAFGVIQERQREADAEAQRVAAQAKAEASQRAIEQHTRWLFEKVTVTLVNNASSNATLWSATPTSVNADGSPVFTYNAICTASPGNTCSSEVYDHQKIQVHIASGWSSYNPNSPWQPVTDDGVTITAHDVTP